MYPILFRVFGFPVHSYGVMLLIGFFVAVIFAKKRAPSFGLKPNDVYDAAFWALILGVLGARVLFIVQEWSYYAKNPRELFSWQFAGLTSFGGIIFGLLGLYVWARKYKKSFVRMLDTMAAPFLVAHAVGRIGCLLNGCCYGVECSANVLLAQHLFANNGKIHTYFYPAQIYDSLMNLAALGLLLLFEKRGIPYGRSISLMFVLHGICRFIYEFWRAGSEQQVKDGLATSTYMGNLPITDAQAAALVVILFGVILYLVLPQIHQRRRIPALEA